MAPDPDAALLLAFQGGDHAAFRVLFEKYGRAMVAFCHRFVRDSARAEEIGMLVMALLASALPARSASRLTIMDSLAYE